MIGYSRNEFNYDESAVYAFADIVHIVLAAYFSNMTCHRIHTPILMAIIIIKESVWSRWLVFWLIYTTVIAASLEKNTPIWIHHALWIDAQKMWLGTSVYRYYTWNGTNFHLPDFIGIDYAVMIANTNCAWDFHEITKYFRCRSPWFVRIGQNKLTDVNQPYRLLK